MFLHTISSQASLIHHTTSQEEAKLVFQKALENKEDSAIFNLIEEHSLFDWLEFQPTPGSSFLAQILTFAPPRKTKFLAFYVQNRLAELNRVLKRSTPKLEQRCFLGLLSSVPHEKFEQLFDLKRMFKDDSFLKMHPIYTAVQSSTLENLDWILPKISTPHLSDLNQAFSACIEKKNDQHLNRLLRLFADRYPCLQGETRPVRFLFLLSSNPNELEWLYPKFYSSGNSEELVNKLRDWIQKAIPLFFTSQEIRFFSSIKLLPKLTHSQYNQWITTGNRDWFTDLHLDLLDSFARDQPGFSFIQDLAKKLRKRNPFTLQENTLKRLKSKNLLPELSTKHFREWLTYTDLSQPCTEVQLELLHTFLEIKKSYARNPVPFIVRKANLFKMNPTLLKILNQCTPDPITKEQFTTWFKESLKTPPSPMKANLLRPILKNANLLTDKEILQHLSLAIQHSSIPLIHLVYDLLPEEFSEKKRSQLIITLLKALFSMEKKGPLHEALVPLWKTLVRVGDENLCITKNQDKNLLRFLASSPSTIAIDPLQTQALRKPFCDVLLGLFPHSDYEINSHLLEKYKEYQTTISQNKNGHELFEQELSKLFGESNERLCQQGKNLVSWLKRTSQKNYDMFCQASLLLERHSKKKRIILDFASAGDVLFEGTIHLTPKRQKEAAVRLYTSRLFLKKGDRYLAGFYQRTYRDCLILLGVSPEEANQFPFVFPKKTLHGISHETFEKFVQINYKCRLISYFSSIPNLLRSHMELYHFLNHLEANPQEWIEKLTKLGYSPSAAIKALNLFLTEANRSPISLSINLRPKKKRKLYHPIQVESFSTVPNLEVINQLRLAWLEKEIPRTQTRYEKAGVIKLLCSWGLLKQSSFL